jgi:hypothetical protein
VGNQHRRDLFGDETLARVRLTPESESLDRQPTSRWSNEQSGRGDVDWLAEDLPGEKPRRRDLFDAETLEMVKLTPEGGRYKAEIVNVPASVSAPWYWPSISNMDEARSAAMQGVAVALFPAVGNLILAGLIAAGVKFPGALALNSDQAWMLVLVSMVYFVIAAGIHCMSRFAAVLGFLLCFLDRMATMVLSGVGVSIFFLLLVAYANAVRGTFIYHELANRGYQ